jgi:hypothetical protein
MCREQRPPNTYQVHLHLDCFDKNSDANFIIGIRFRKSTGQDGYSIRPLYMYIRTTPAARCRHGLRRAAVHIQRRPERDPITPLQHSRGPIHFPDWPPRGTPPKLVGGRGGATTRFAHAVTSSTACQSDGLDQSGIPVRSSRPLRSRSTAAACTRRWRFLVLRRSAEKSRFHGQWRLQPLEPIPAPRCNSREQPARHVLLLAWLERLDTSPFNYHFLGTK